MSIDIFLLLVYNMLSFFMGACLLYVNGMFSKEDGFEQSRIVQRRND